MAQDDSPLSMTANILAILTFVVALAVGFYARATWLRNKLQADMQFLDHLKAVYFILRDTSLLESDKDLYTTREGEIHVRQLYARLFLLSEKMLQYSRMSITRRMRSATEHFEFTGLEIRNVERLLDSLRYRQLRSKLSEISQIVMSCEREISDLRTRPGAGPPSNPGHMNGDVSPTTTTFPHTVVYDDTLSRIESPVFRTSEDAEPNMFSIEFRAFQHSMSQARSVKLQLQGIQSLYDLASLLEDERDRVLERLQKLGLREDSFKILSITATTYR